MKEYVVIEVCNSYVICHGSGLTWAEAHLLVMSQMMNDANCTESGMLQNVKMFELEVNDPGFGVSYEYDGNKTRYYILDDPGKMVQGVKEVSSDEYAYKTWAT